MDQQTADTLQPGTSVALRDAEGLLLATLQVEECWNVDREREAQAVYGTTDQTHPAVHYLFNQTKDVYVGGKVNFVSLPHHYDFTHLRLTPDKLKQYFRQNDWKKIVAFQTRNPMHRAHQELTIRAAQNRAISSITRVYVVMSMSCKVIHLMLLS